MKSSFSNYINLFVFGVLLLLSSCAEEKFPGYSEAEQGVYYKLHIPGESGKKAGPDDYYEVMMYNKFGEEVIYDSQMESASGTILMQSEASRFFNVLSEGDSATFLLSGSGLVVPGMPDTGMIEMNVKIVGILTPDQVQEREAKTDPDAGEVLIIQRYLARNSKPYEPDSAGAVVLVKNQGSGAEIAKGDSVRLQLKGELLNGRVFDDSKSYGGMSFTYGDEGQVLPGIRAALIGLKEGGYVKIILPSRLAFGTGGSSTGIVPPHMPVIYTIEILHTR